MMFGSCRGGCRPTGVVCGIFGLCLFILLFTHPASAQINIIHQEGFNDDGDGTRYTMIGRGQEVLDIGPGMWEHSFLVDVIGLPAVAPAKRAAILWTGEATEDDFTEDSLGIWDNLINYMIDDKAGATVGFVGETLDSETSDFLSFRLEEAGHTVLGLGTLSADFPDPADIDLVIQTNVSTPDNLTFFASSAGTGYPVPMITFHAGQHDDELVSSIGLLTSGGPTVVSVVEANADHPVLGGKTGTIAWVDEFLAETPLQGVGQSVPAKSKTLLTYEDGGQTFSALLLIEEGEPLVGAFAPVPEGEGYIVGADMNERFPDEAGEFTGAANPRVVQLNPVDISGETGVKVSVALAATDVDFESPDFLRIAYSEDPLAEFPEDFIELARFDGMAPGVLVSPDLGALNPNEFTDFTFEIPDDVNTLVLRIEAFDTFPNEVVGIDNIRIFTGEELEIDPLDCNMDGAVDFGDLDCGNAAGITSELLTQLNLLPGDLDGQGGVAFPDFLILSANFGQADKIKYTEGDIDGMGGVAFPDFLALSANFGQSAGGAAAAVPEPASMTVLALGGMLLCLARRRRS